MDEDSAIELLNEFDLLILKTMMNERNEPISFGELMKMLKVENSQQISSEKGKTNSISLFI